MFPRNMASGVVGGESGTGSSFGPDCGKPSWL